MSIFYTIPEKDYQEILAFAEKRMEDSQALYMKRGKTNLDKIKQDIVTGAVAEVAVSQYIRSLGLECNKPDFALYKPKQKSFSADLQCEGYSLHVKSQCFESARKYGTSWLFQKQDKLFVKEKNKKDLLVLCLSSGKFCSIEAIMPVKDIVEGGLISEPKVWIFKNSKVAIYLLEVLRSKKGDVDKWINKLKRAKQKRSSKLAE